MKIHPAGAELLHAEGQTFIQTDTTKLTVAFRSFSINFKTLVKVKMNVNFTPKHAIGDTEKVAV